jgi:cytochrome c-type biogenesis protein
MTPPAHISVDIAFLAGLVSFVSPCVLPLVPAYLSLLTGSSLEELQANESGGALRALAIGHACAFILGFTLVFVALGLTASEIGGVLNAHRMLIAQIGGVIVVVLGLHMMGALRIPLLMRDTRVHLQRERRSYWSSGLVGIAFAAGWSPCIGPILAGILALASQQQNAQAALLLLAYSLGLAVPFFLTAVAIGAVLPVLNRIKRFLPAIEFGAGVFLIAVGLVLVNNAFLTVAGWFYQFVPTPNL